MQSVSYFYITTSDNKPAADHLDSCIKSELILKFQIQ